jgi:hypothetical protein
MPQPIEALHTQSDFTAAILYDGGQSARFNTPQSSISICPEMVKAITIKNAGGDGRYDDADGYAVQSGVSSWFAGVCDEQITAFIPARLVKASDRLNHRRASFCPSSSGAYIRMCKIFASEAAARFFLPQ